MIPTPHQHQLTWNFGHHSPALCQGAGVSEWPKSLLGTCHSRAKEEFQRCGGWPPNAVGFGSSHPLLVENPTEVRHTKFQQLIIVFPINIGHFFGGATPQAGPKDFPSPWPLHQHVANALLQFLGFGEAALRLPRPNLR